MLDFHIGTGGINKVGKHIGGLEMDELEWLQINGYIKKTETGHYNGNPECIPYFDDVILSHEQVLNVYNTFNNKLIDNNKKGELKYQAINKFKDILESAINLKQGLSTIAD